MYVYVIKPRKLSERVLFPFYDGILTNECIRIRIAREVEGWRLVWKLGKGKKRGEKEGGGIKLVGGRR